jgi:alpha-1,3-rhamnosyl/mannosyltransferase
VYPGATRTIIHSGDAPRLPDLSGRPYILAIGTREPRKNLPRLVDAFGLLHPGQRHTALVLAGPPGPDDPAIQEAIGRLPRDAAEQVLVTDYLHEADRDAVVAGAAVVAYPSLDEGFGFPALEGMAAGVPVVAARAGAIPEVAGDAAVLVDPLDPAALASGLDRALTDDSLRAQLVTAGHVRVQRFTWPAMADGMVALYRDAMSAA